MHMRLLLLLGLVIAFSGVLVSQRSLGSNVGVMNTLANDSDVCLAIKNSRLRKGQIITLVNTDRPQSTRRFAVREKTYTNCSSEIEPILGASYYLLKGRRLDWPAVDIAVVGQPRVTRKRGLVRIDLTGDDRGEYFRSCTSNEGIHLTIWNGLPLKSKRIWHSYFYLKYDTQPTCKHSDYRATH